MGISFIGYATKKTIFLQFTSVNDWRFLGVAEHQRTLDNEHKEREE